MLEVVKFVCDRALAPTGTKLYELSRKLVDNREYVPETKENQDSKKKYPIESVDRTFDMTFQALPDP